MLARDPDIAAFGSFFGNGGGNTLNTARFFIALKPRDERKATAMDDHQPAAAATGQGRRRSTVPAAVAGHHRRRAHFRRPISIHHAGSELRRAEHLGAENARQAEDAAGARRRLDRPADQCAAARRDHQPRRRGALRHSGAGDRRHAERRLRPGRQVAQYFTQTKFLFRRARNPARTAEGSEFAEPDLRQGAVDRTARAALDAGQFQHQYRRPAFWSRISRNSRR